MLLIILEQGYQSNIPIKFELNWSRGKGKVSVSRYFLFFLAPFGAILFIGAEKV